MLMLDVLAGKRTDRTPIWIMRQAGRYMPEYLEVRKNYNFIEMCLTPEVAAEVTMQPIDAFGMDASIIFSDILIPAISMGLDLDFIKGEGPVFSNPVRTENDVNRLVSDISGDEVEKVAEAVTLVRKSLPETTALIGFCGAPLTLASYMVEGGTTKNFSILKGMLYSEPKTYHKLMEKITPVLVDYLVAQAEAGANIVQIFDTWGGILAQEDFLEFSLPYIKEVIKGFRAKSDKPVIYFMKSNASFLKYLNNLDVEALGMDWTINLREASEATGNNFTLQGNLEPLVLLGDEKLIKERATRILEEGKNLKGHIFNLGHGVIPQTPVENVRYLVNLVKEFRR